MEIQRDDERGRRGAYQSPSLGGSSPMWEHEVVKRHFAHQNKH